MSIANNVITTNANLTTARTEIRNKLTQYGIYFWNDDDIFTLVRRAQYLTGAYKGGGGYSYPDVLNYGENEVGISIYDGNYDALIGYPVDVVITINGVSTHYMALSIDGYKKIMINIPTGTNQALMEIYAGDKQLMSKTFNVYAFYYSQEDPFSDIMTVWKYPGTTSITLRDYVWDSSYNERGMQISKGYGSAEAGYVIPTEMTDGIYLGASYESGYQGIHFHAQIIPQQSSSSGWASGIALLTSKSLSHYRDNAILELGAYPGKKGIKYSGVDHTIYDQYCSSGQLTLDSVWYDFDLYYRSGVGWKGIISNNGTVVYSNTNTSPPASVNRYLQTNRVYPVLMVYDYGGKGIFRDILIEPWDGS